MCPPSPSSDDQSDVPSQPSLSPSLLAKLDSLVKLTEDVRNCLDNGTHQTAGDEKDALARHSSVGRLTNPNRLDESGNMTGLLNERSSCCVARTFQNPDIIFSHHYHHYNSPRSNTVVVKSPKHSTRWLPWRLRAKTYYNKRTTRSSSSETWLSEEEKEETDEEGEEEEVVNLEAEKEEEIEVVDMMSGGRDFTQMSDGSEIPTKIVDCTEGREECSSDQESLVAADLVSFALQPRVCISPITATPSPLPPHTLSPVGSPESRIRPCSVVVPRLPLSSLQKRVLGAPKPIALRSQVDMEHTESSTSSLEDKNESDPDLSVQSSRRHRSSAASKQEDGDNTPSSPSLLGNDRIEFLPPVMADIGTSDTISEAGSGWEVMELPEAGPAEAGTSLGREHSGSDSGVDEFEHSSPSLLQLIPSAKRKEEEEEEKQTVSVTERGDRGESLSLSLSLSLPLSLSPSPSHC